MMKFRETKDKALLENKRLDDDKQKMKKLK
jgi:hypothetical protein